jgi:RNA polymerase sigma-70 factor (ECF subfamily)
MIIMERTDLLAQCRAGDQVAVEQLVKEYQSRLYRLAISILDDGSKDGSADAQEVTQDALLSAIRSLDSYRGEAKLSTWLFSITVNLCRNRIRARRRRERTRRIFQTMTNPIEEPPLLPEEAIAKKQSDLVVFSAVQSLNEKHRLPVILRYYHDCPVLEIAQILDIPEGTVHSRLNTARKRLKKCLSEQNKESYR